MKGKPGPVADYLRPILDTYHDSAVALVGCSSRGMQRYSCEFDLLVVVDEIQPPASFKFGDVLVDTVFLPEKEVLRPTYPEHALALALCRPVRDTSLVISTGSATSAATLSNSAVAARRNKLTAALKSITRADAALAKGGTIDADFWLLTSSYEFAFALLLSSEVLPSPSHLLSQLRSASEGAPHGFEGVSIGAGLDMASRAGCGARLEGVTVLHDLLREGADPESESKWSQVKTQIMSLKAQELVTRVELAECYSFLGQELVEALAAILKARPKKTLASLTSGDDRLLGERLVRQLGLLRPARSIRQGLEILKKQVAFLAKE